jgi:hypothetical protein
MMRVGINSPQGEIMSGRIGDYKRSHTRTQSDRTEQQEAPTSPKAQHKKGRQVGHVRTQSSGLGVQPTEKKKAIAVARDKFTKLSEKQGGDPLRTKKILREKVKSEVAKVKSEVAKPLDMSNLPPLPSAPLPNTAEAAFAEQAIIEQFRNVRPSDKGPSIEIANSSSSEEVEKETVKVVDLASPRTSGPPSRPPPPIPTGDGSQNEAQESKKPGDPS